MVVISSKGSITSEEIMDKDRRKFKRFDAYMSVRCHLPGGDKAEAISLTKDISREGIKINSNRSLEKGATVDLEIVIPDDPKPIQTQGRVMWTTPSEGSNQGFDHGVHIVRMDPVDKFRVLDFAYNHWLETRVDDFADAEDIQESK